MNPDGLTAIAFIVLPTMLAVIALGHAQKIARTRARNTTTRKRDTTK